MHCNHLGIAALFATTVLIVLATSAPAQIVPPPGGDDGGINPDQVIIQWPSRRYPTIQAAIDALPAHGKLLIREGTFRVQEPINIVRPITIQGAGCRFDTESIGTAAAGELTTVSDGVDQDRPFTRLRGPRPQVVVEPELSDGLLNFIGPEAGGVIRGLELVGFDAGVFLKEIPGASAADAISAGTLEVASIEAVTISETCFIRNGRGLLAKTSAPVAVRNSVFKNNMWNAISASGDPRVGPALFSLEHTLISTARNSCLFFDTKYAVITDSLYGYCGPGGAVGAINSILSVTSASFTALNGPGITLIDSTANLRYTTISGAKKYGIVALRSVLTVEANSQVTDTQPTSNGSFGDGIVALEHSNALLLNSQVRNSPRSAVGNFGSSMTLGNMRLKCAAFELQGEPFLGRNFAFTDLGNNKCGCPTANETCVADSIGLLPPERVTPTE